MVDNNMINNLYPDNLNSDLAKNDAYSINADLN